MTISIVMIYVGLLAAVLLHWHLNLRLRPLRAWPLDRLVLTEAERSLLAERGTLSGVEYRCWLQLSLERVDAALQRKRTDYNADCERRQALDRIQDATQQAANGATLPKDKRAALAGLIAVPFGFAALWGAGAGPFLNVLGTVAIALVAKAIYETGTPPDTWRLRVVKALASYAPADPAALDRLGSCLDRTDTLPVKDVFVWLEQERAALAGATTQ